MTLCCYPDSGPKRAQKQSIKAADVNQCGYSTGCRVPKALGRAMCEKHLDINKEKASRRRSGQRKRKPAHRSDRGGDDDISDEDDSGCESGSPHVEQQYRTAKSSNGGNRKEAASRSSQANARSNKRSRADVPVQTKDKPRDYRDDDDKYDYESDDGVSEGVIEVHRELKEEERQQRAERDEDLRLEAEFLSKKSSHGNNSSVRRTVSNVRSVLQPQARPSHCVAVRRPYVTMSMRRRMVAPAHVSSVSDPPQVSVTSAQSEPPSPDCESPESECESGSLELPASRSTEE